MNPQQRYDLITRNLQEVTGGKYLMNLLTKNERSPVVYWGTAPTGKIHIGYLMPMMKIKDLVDAGCNVVILIADIHAFLDNMKSTLEQIDKRSEYYIKILCSLLKLLNTDITKIKFVKGSDYQLNKDTVLNLLKLASVTSVSQSQHAGAEVVKKGDDPKLTGLLYPLLQSLDEFYLNADCELGGIDQRKIFGYSMDFMPKIGMKREMTYLMNPMVSLSDDKMSSSDVNSKIDLTESINGIKKKINKIFCEECNVDKNPLLELIRIIIFRLSNNFTINRPEQYGGNISYDNFETLKDDVKKGSLNGGLHPQDLKSGFIKFITDLLEPIRNEFNTDENKQLIKEAYE